MRKRVTIPIIMSLLLVAGLVASLFSPAMAATGSIVITKYDSDGTNVLDRMTVDVRYMESNLPVMGDGITKYYHQGPTFDSNNPWDKGETINLRDKGVLKGSKLADLCDLVGGAEEGNVIKVKATDGYSKSFDYQDIYAPESAQGDVVICWWKNGSYMPAYTDGPQLVFFARTANADGQYVFGNWDMHETLPQSRWHHHYDGQTYWPATDGLSVKWINQINIYQH